MPPPGPGVAETQCTLSRAALHKGGPVPAQKTAATIARPALLAQLVEHLHGKEGVSGSSPEEGFAKGSHLGASGRSPMEQLVERTSEPSGGSQRSRLNQV